MYRKIIVGHDLQDGGRDALALGRLISEATGARLVVAGIFPIAAQPFAFPPEWHEAEKRMASEIQQAADAVGAEAETFPSSSPTRGLHDFAEDAGADLVVLGSSRHSKVGEIFAGNVGLGLLHGSPCAVAIAPKGYREHDGGLRTIVVGCDSSHESDLALEDASDLAKAGGCQLKLVAVAEPPAVGYGKGAGAGQGYQELRTAIEEQVREALDEARMTIPDDIEAEATLVSGDPAEKLAEAARPAGSVLILGSRAYGPLRRVLLGSVSSALIHSAPCPVIVHPRGTKAEADAEAEAATA